MNPKPLKDEQAVIAKAHKLLTNDLYEDFIKALAELEDNENHRTQKFPHTRLHKVKGAKENVYRADVNKIKGWRIHVKFGDNNTLYLCDILTGEEHDDTLKVIKKRKNRYK